MNAPAQPALPPLEILIVEDSATQAQRLQHILEQHGYLVTIAANGREALEVAQGRKPFSGSPRDRRMRPLALTPMWKSSGAR